MFDSVLDTIITGFLVYFGWTIGSMLSALIILTIIGIIILIWSFVEWFRG